jgi:hypothetical protein
METQLIEYDTQKADIKAVLESFRSGGVLVSLHRGEFCRVDKLDKYINAEGEKSLLIQVKGHSMRDLGKYKTVIIRV